MGEVNGKFCEKAKINFHNSRSAASFISLFGGSKNEMKIFCLLHTIPLRHVQSQEMFSRTRNLGILVERVHKQRNVVEIMKITKILIRSTIILQLQRQEKLKV